MGEHYNIDSLQALTKIDKDDTNKVFHLYSLSRELSKNNPDSSIRVGIRSKQLAEKLNWKKGIAYSNIVMGFSYYVQGNYPKALEMNLEAVSSGEKLKDKKIISVAFSNLGQIYDSQRDYTKALDCYFRALKLDEEMEDKWGIARNLGIIGLVYYAQKIYPKALDYYFRALKISEEVGNKNGVAVWLANIGDIYKDKSDYTKALDYQFRSLKIFEELGNKWSSAENLCSIGSSYTSTKKYLESFNYLYRALALSDSIKAMDDVKNCYDALSTLYEKSNIPLYDSIGGKLLNMEQMRLRSLYYNRRFISIRDTLFSRERQKQIMNFEYEKQTAIARAEQEKKDVLALKELQKQKLLRNEFVVGFAVVLLFAGIFFTQRNRISKEKKISDTEKKRSEELLLNILPHEVAQELKQSGQYLAKTYSMVTVMFADFKDFTSVSEKVSAELLVNEINICFSAFDKIIQNYKVEKIKTVGDAYMCASGLPVLNYTHAVDMVTAAIELRNFMFNRRKEKEEKGEIPFEIRIGIHTGPVVAGIVGIKKFAYDIWGDTVNIASRIESSGEAGKVNVSGTTYELVKNKFHCVHRGKIKAKNKGEIDMYFVENNL